MLSGWHVIEDDNSLMGGVMIRSHGDFEWVVDRFVLCYRLLLTWSANFLIIVPLDVGYCLLHLIYLSLSDCISPIR